MYRVLMDKKSVMAFTQLKEAKMLPSRSTHISTSEIASVPREAISWLSVRSSPRIRAKPTSAL